MENIKTLRLISTYYRVSTSTQEEEKTIETQILAVKEFAEKNNLTIVKEYVDNGWSGDILARPSLDQLRQDAKEDKWEAVLIYDPDRLARRYSYQELVMDELREAGKEIIFVTINAPKNSEDKILHGVRGLFAEYERAKISERFRLGKVRKAKEGHLLVSEPLYGYKYIPKQDKTHGYYEINESEARVVRKIFNWVLDGYTLRTVVKKLLEYGIRPRKSKRGVWNTSTLSTMLRNKAYIGEARWGSSYAVIPEKPYKIEKYKKMKKSSRRNKPEGEWITSTIPVPPIIDKDIFYKAVEQLKNNFAFCQRNKKNGYLLTSKIFCTCGRRRTGEGPMKGKHLYYRCTDRVLSSPLPANCKEKGINARIADKLVWDKVANLMSSPELLSKQLNRFLKTKEVKSNSVVSDVEAIKKEILKLKEQEERYSKAYGSGLFTVEQLKTYIDPIRENLRSLELQISSAKQERTETSSMLPSEEEIDKFANESKEALKNLNFNAKKGIMMNVIDRIIGTKEELKVYGNIPIKSYVEFKSNHRCSRTSKCREIDAF